MRGGTRHIAATCLALLVGSATVAHAYSTSTGIDSPAAVDRVAIRVDAPSADKPPDHRLLAVDQVNAERADRGLDPLTWDERVADAAAAHASDMVVMGRMQHAGSDGSSAGDRLLRAGYVWSTWGENVAAGFGDPASVVAAWMASPGHRAHLLGAFGHVGVGIAASSDGTLYWALVAAS